MTDRLLWGSRATNITLNLDSSGTLDLATFKLTLTADVTLPGAFLPAGNDTDVQFNDGGVMGGDDNFTWDKTAVTLSLFGAAGSPSPGYAYLAGVSNGTALGLLITGGNAGFGSSLAGGGLGLSGGNGDGGAVGGWLALSGGSGSPGGYCTLSGGSADAGSNSDGGALTFSGGSGDGTGSGGALLFVGGLKGTPGGADGDVAFQTGGLIKFTNASIYGILDFTGLTSSDKTYTFPDASGTLALGAGMFTLRAHPIYTLGDSIMSGGTLQAALVSTLGDGWTALDLCIGGDTTVRVLARTPNDVISPGDAEYCIVLCGVNDIVGGSSAGTIETNLQSIYTALHNAGIKVIACTLTPWKSNASWSSGFQTVTDTVNTWILATAANVDYPIDAYTALEDPGNADTLLAAYDSGDGLHLSTAGETALGAAIIAGATFTPAATYLDLGVSANVYLNQSLRRADSPQFNGLTIVNESNADIPFKVTLNNYSFNSIAEVARLTHDSTTGGVSAGFGASMDVYLESATVADRQAARWATSWTTATDATRTSKSTLSPVENGTLIETLGVIPYILYNPNKNNLGTGAKAGLALGATDVTSSAYMLDIIGGAPSIRQQVERASGGFAFSMFDLYAKNTTSSAIQNVGQVGILGNVDTDPMTTYLYMSAKKSPAYNDDQFILMQSGYVGLGTIPTHPIEVVSGPGRCASWGYNGVDGTAQTIIADGTGDVTEGITVQYVASEVTGADSYGGTVYLEPGDSWVVCTDDTNILTLACAANGSVTVQRTAGTDTYKFTAWLVWQ